MHPACGVGACGLLIVRADAAYCSHAAIATIGETAWIPIRYSNADFD